MQKPIGLILAGLFVLLIAGVGGTFLVHARGMHSSCMMMQGSDHHGMMGSMHHWMHGSSPERDAEERPEPAANQESVEAGEVDEVFVLETDFQQGLAFSRRLDNDPESVRLNPTLRVHRGDRVKIKLINTVGGTHDLAIPGLDIGSDVLTRRGGETSFTFIASRVGTFFYYCTVPGHRSAGMEGKLVVTP